VSGPHFLAEIPLDELENKKKRGEERRGEERRGEMNDCQDEIHGCTAIAQPFRIDSALDPHRLRWDREASIAMRSWSDRDTIAKRLQSDCKAIVKRSWSDCESIAMQYDTFLSN
jgi:hypothetical protein